MSMLTPEELARLEPAENVAFGGPLPTRVVSSDEFMPIAQTPRQREVEARLAAAADALAPKHGLDRRGFLRSAAGMAAAFAAMNDVYGPLYGVGRAEAASPATGLARIHQQQQAALVRAALGL